MGKKFASLLVSLFVIGAIIAGCSEQAKVDQPEILKIVSRVPGSNATWVYYWDSLSLTFNFPIDTNQFSINDLFAAYGSDHTAGTPDLSSATLEWSDDNKTLTISGIQGWSNLTRGAASKIVEVVAVAEKIKNVYSNVMHPGEVLWKFSLAERGPIIPTVVSVSPTVGSIGQAIDTQVRATFSKEMDSSTINNTTFSLAGSQITGSVSYDAASRTAIFNPADLLPSYHVFVATISALVKDTDGRSLGTDYTWSFTTGSGVSGWSKHIIEDFFNDAWAVYAADIDGDGDMDVLGAAYTADEIAWWENDGNESFTKHSIDNAFNGANSVYATDVDGDGDVDILGTAGIIGRVAWWENDGSQNFNKQTIDGAFAGADSVYATDVDGDGDVDVLGSAGLDNEIAWWENNGSELFSGHSIDSSFGGARSVYAIDLDGDSDMDVLGAAYAADEIAWWENDGSENFSKNSIDSSFDGAYSVFSADVDGDGDLDVLGAADEGDEIAWWENDGSENFTKHSLDNFFDGARSVYAADVDGDGDLDILGAASRIDEITWWENKGNQNFFQHRIDSTFDGAYSVYAADVDGDSDLDVLGAAYSANEIAWWENLGP